MEICFRPEITYIVNQCARLSTDPRKEHGQALRWLGKYFKDNINEGTKIQLEKVIGLEVRVDAYLQVIGTCKRVSIDKPLDQDMAMSLCMRGVPYFTSTNYKPKLHYQALKVSILVFLIR